ncbi:endothelin-converting enzyme 2-like [Ixodes scapularis]|uniref:endothelin-converting enzyme 2-like n=1 Tax=Ixodes scapularis TaxID=6945 RepID=UPI001AD74FE2|nr:endothelin-converting enzyme 2-like [Ixodes scapularis]
MEARKEPPAARLPQSSHKLSLRQPLGSLLAKSLRVTKMLKDRKPKLNAKKLQGGEYRDQPGAITAPSGTSLEVPGGHDQADTKEAAEGQQILTPDVQQIASKARSSRSARVTKKQEDIGDIRHLVDSPQAARSPNKLSWHEMLITRIMFFLTLVALTLIIMVLIFRLHQSRSVSHSDVCDTEDCLDYAYRITQMLNRNLNPCKNFSAFVCSAWTENNQNIAAGSVTDGVIQKWLKEITSALQSDNFNASVIEAGNKAKAEFASCMNRTHEDQREVLSSLRNFMTQRGLSWPDKSPANVSALHVLIDLDVNWLVPFWFRVHILPTYDSRPRAIQISPSALTRIWHLQHRSVAHYSVTAYAIYWSFVFSLLAQEKDASLYAIQAKHDFHLQEQVVSELQREPITWEPHVTSIKDLLRYQDWLTGLRKVFETALPLHADVTVYITDKRHFDRMSRILERFSNDQLIAHISWWFAQFGGIIAISEALVGFYGSRGEAAQKRVDLCARGVESVYYPLLTSTFARKYWKRNDEKREQFARKNRGGIHCQGFVFEVDRGGRAKKDHNKNQECGYRSVARKRFKFGECHGNVQGISEQGKFISRFLDQNPYRNATLPVKNKISAIIFLETGESPLI